MKKAKKSLTPTEIKKQVLMKELYIVQNDMERTYTNLENVVDTEIIDCLIYELNATQIRYKVILNQVQELISNWKEAKENRKSTEIIYRKIVSEVH